MEVKVSLSKAKMFLPRIRGQNRKMSKQFTTVQLDESWFAFQQLFTTVLRIKNVAAPPQLVTVKVLQ